MFKRNEMLNALLRCSGESAPSITHALCAYGDGKMAEGVVKLWKHGQGVGAAKTLGAVGAVVGLYVFVKQQIIDYKTRKEIRELCEAKGVTPAEAAPEVEPAQSVTLGVEH